jgi:hypothetical protein
MSKKKSPPKSKRIRAKKKAAPRIKDNRAVRKKKRLYTDAPKPVQTLIPDRDEAESVTMTEITTVKKLTTKIIVGKKIGKIEQRTTLYTVIGVASDLKTGESNYGAWTALVGRFEAERTADGQMFIAPLLLLPDEATAAPIISAVKIHEGVEFALIVSAEPTLSAPGYVYDITAVVAPRRNDMLAILRATLREYVNNALDPSPVL